MEKTKSGRLIKLLLKVLVTAAAIWFITQKLDFAKVGSTLRHVHWGWLIPALLLFVLSKWLSAFRLQHFWRALPLELSHRFNLRLYLLGMFYNLFLPGGIGGDGYKVYLLRKRNKLPVKNLVSALLLDRVSGLALLVTLALALSAFISLPYGLNQWLWITIPLVLGLHFLGLRLVFKRFTPTFLPAAAWSFGVQGAQALCAIALLLTLRIEAQFIDYVFIFLLSSIVLVVPLPSFGGLGLREAVILLGANELGLNEEISVALSLLFYLISAAVSACGLYFHFRPDQLEGASTA